MRIRIQRGGTGVPSLTAPVAAKSGAVSVNRRRVLVSPAQKPGWHSSPYRACQLYRFRQSANWDAGAASAFVPLS
jgi:hypothetical protein